jgi:hypothetical protein
VSKVLKIAAVVVGIAAVIVTGGAALGLLPAVIPALGISTALLGTILSVTATVLGLAAGLLAKPPKLGSTGQQLDFRADPASGEPYVVGDAMIGASIVHQASWGSKNKNLGMIGVLSLGPIMAYDGLYADMTQISFSSGNATGYYHNFLYNVTQLGAQPESAALTPGVAGMPDWGSTYKLSGLAAQALVLVADVDNGKVFSGGAPKLTNRIRGVLAYDARLDSTQPSGSGTQRALTESTYVYSENPWVHAETWALGRWQNGVRVIGPGLAPAQIDFASFMQAATIADTNGWKISGQVMSTDPKWDVLKAMCQAGGGVPMPTAAHLSCMVNTPRVSIFTITENDVKGAVTAPQMLTRRQRLNGAIPRYRSSSHGWEIVPADAVRNSTWLAADGGVASTKEFEFALVADQGDGNGLKQAAQLAAYEVGNSRERGPISVELSWLWAQYKVGDCGTLNLPSANLSSQKCVVIGRTLNASRNSVTLEFRTEDDTKHTWALAQTGAVSTSPVVVQTPGIGDDTLTTPQVTQLIKSSAVTGMTFSVSVPSGGNSTVIISNHTRVYSDKSVSVTGNGAGQSVAAAAGDLIIAYYDDASRVGGSETYQFLVLPGGVGDQSSAFPSPTNPFRHAVFSKTVPSTGTGTGGSSAGSGGGGYGNGGGGGGLSYN